MTHDPCIEVLPCARRAPRCAVRLDCELRIDGGRELRYGTVTDLSPDGLWIEGGRPLAAGTELTACFLPPGDDVELLLSARVVRVAESRRGMGLRFCGLGDEERARLERCARGLPELVQVSGGRVFARAGDGGEAGCERTFGDEAEELVGDELLYEGDEVIVLRPSDVVLVRA